MYAISYAIMIDCIRLWGLQATLVAAWLTELHLDTINRALLEVGGRLLTHTGPLHNVFPCT